MDQKKSLAYSVFTFLGGLSGCISIALIIWKWGVVFQVINDHERRLNNIETGGSIGLREHVKLDDDRVENLKLRQGEQAARITQQEATAARLLELFGEVKVVNAKLDAIKEQINKK